MNSTACPLGTVYWVTGLAGAGKTTIGNLLAKTLRERGHSVVFLDGDKLREILGSGAGYSSEARMDLAFCYARLCREIAQQGLDVVCATISMFHAVRSWNRQNIPRYEEIFLNPPLATLKARNQKNLYSENADFNAGQVVGREIPPEFPENPSIEFSNDGTSSPEELVSKILNATLNSGER